MAKVWIIFDLHTYVLNCEQNSSFFIFQSGLTPNDYRGFTVLYFLQPSQYLRNLSKYADTASDDAFMRLIRTKGKGGCGLDSLGRDNV
jgi:hypothetical protein